jgi:hypothetical protein
MSASPGAYLTSIQPGVWYKLSDREWILPIFVNATITANTNYGPFVAPNPHQLITNIILTVTAVSGTSPTLTIGVTIYDIVAAINGTYESGFNATIFSNISSPGTYSSAGTNTFYAMFTISVTVGGTSPSFTATLTIYIMV